MSVRVFVAYPYPIVLHALKALIERQGHQVVGDCSDVAEVTGITVAIRGMTEAARMMG